MQNVKFPTKLNIVCRKDKILIDDNEVYNAFPVNADVSSAVATALEWGSNTYLKKQDSEESVIIYELDNTGFIDAKIVDLSIRSEGGRAYKTILNNMFYVDLREKTLIQIIKNHRIDKGIINVPLVYIQVGSQMTLVIRDSIEHKQAISQNNIREKKNITKYKIGHIYKSLSGNYGIYLGEYYVREYKCISSPNSWYRQSKLEFKYSISKPKKKKLFYTISYGYYNDPKILKNIKEFLNNPEFKEDISYYLSIYNLKAIQKPTYKTEGELFIEELNFNKLIAVYTEMVLRKEANNNYPVLDPFMFSQTNDFISNEELEKLYYRENRRLYIC